MIRRAQYDGRKKKQDFKYHGKFAGAYSYRTHHSHHSRTRRFNCTCGPRWSQTWCDCHTPLGPVGWVAQPTCRRGRLRHLRGQRVWHQPAHADALTQGASRDPQSPAEHLHGPGAHSHKRDHVRCSHQPMTNTGLRALTAHVLDSACKTIYVCHFR